MNSILICRTNERQIYSSYVTRVFKHQVGISKNVLNNYKIINQSCIYKSHLGYLCNERSVYNDIN